MAKFNQKDYDDYLKDHSGEYETVLWSGSSQNADGKSCHGSENAERICN